MPTPATPTPAPDGADRGTLASRLEHLFATVHPADRKPYTLREVAEAINTKAGTKLISPNYLWQLRNGERTEPSHTRLTAIADFFGVDVSYFSNDRAAQQVDEQLDIVVALRDAGVRALALRAAGLSPQSLTAILGMIENARRLEGLPQDGPTAP